MWTIVWHGGALSARREQVGPLDSGRFLLNSGWVLQPAGRQIPLDTFPMAAAASRDGRYLLALNAGYAAEYQRDRPDA